MSSRAVALALLIPLAALAQDEGGSVAPPESYSEAAPLVENGTPFEQTSPPSLETDEYSPLGERPTPLPEPDPASEKIRQVQEILDTGASAPAPAESTTDSTTRSLFLSTVKAISSLCVVVALILVATYLLKRMGGKTPLLAGASMGQILGRVHLNSRNALYFVRTAGKILVVGVSPSGMAPIAEFDAEALEGPEEVVPSARTAAPERSASTFKQQLAAGLRDSLAPEPDAAVDDEEIAALRRDVRRLQQLLQDSSSGRQI